jgi:gentisate 1,2-dioxygenase
LSGAGLVDEQTPFRANSSSLLYLFPCFDLTRESEKQLCSRGGHDSLEHAQAQTDPVRALERNKVPPFQEKKSKKLDSALHSPPVRHMHEEFDTYVCLVTSPKKGKQEMATSSTPQS